ncbi:MAG TPA: hypothetical protein VHO68_15940, partial [Bacteroidales bacterium]|nr:hypothetical protein [Bacteroidales bacterium]
SFCFYYPLLLGPPLPRERGKVYVIEILNVLPFSPGRRGRGLRVTNFNEDIQLVRKQTFDTAQKGERSVKVQIFYRTKT